MALMLSLAVGNVDTTGFAMTVLLWVSGLFILYFVLLDLSYIFFFVFGALSLRNYRHYIRVVDFHALLRTSLTKPISILVPAYNEEKNILETVRSLLTLNYPQFEIIVLNDGSTDGTLDLLKKEFKMVARSVVYQRKLQSKQIKAIYEANAYPNLIVVDKDNGGKSDALNVGINVSHFPYVCTIDADSILDSDALLKMVRPFIEHPDTMMGVGGVIRVANNCVVEYGQVQQVNLPGNWLALTQVVEYLQSFLSSRIAFAQTSMVLLISGACGLYRKDALIEIGGYRTDTIGEDMEIVVRLNRYMRKKKRPHKMFFMPDPICWTEVPTDFKSLSLQRKRWQKGLMDSLRFNSEMMFNPRYGRMGLISMPYYFLFELLGPIIEFSGWVFMLVFWIFNVLSLQWFLVFLAVSAAFGFLFSVATILLEEISFHRYPRRRHLFGLLLGGALYNLGFRQLNAVWRTIATLEYIVGITKWGKMRRTGFRTQSNRQTAGR